MICTKCGTKTLTKTTRKKNYVCASCAARDRSAPNKKRFIPIPTCPVCKELLDVPHYGCFSPKLTMDQRLKKVYLAFGGKIYYYRDGYYCQGIRVSMTEITKRLRFMFFNHKEVKKIVIEIYLRNSLMELSDAK